MIAGPDEPQYPAPACSGPAGCRARAGDVAALFAPVVFGLLAFASGAYMLIAAMTPALPAPLKAAAHYLPLPVIELSHFLASVVGLFLLIVANGLARRLSHAGWLPWGC